MSGKVTTRHDVCISLSSALEAGVRNLRDVAYVRRDVDMRSAGQEAFS